ncbi:hypothetical protein F5J12DRAFT_960767 [Pisolithus orientalis]|uniref:uncharacterized protein n=1 Tax=Pisolithus orientalis TaxID=936130 RepID=UPI0022250439|nr:uncharacterized protein F5J12DRAFT_960767 [Pisolithus orientalis]KAI6028693.1 hypothetical protein F5J12DRAFT_960767 [Pisolithus orientalis]
MAVAKEILTVQSDGENALSCLGENGEWCDQQTSSHSRRDALEEEDAVNFQNHDSNLMLSSPSDEISLNVLPSCTAGSQVNAATPHAIPTFAWLPPWKLLNFTEVPGRPLLHVPETPGGLNSTCIPQPVPQTYAEARVTAIRVIMQRRRAKASVASPGTFERSTTIESGVLDSSPVFGGRDRYTLSLKSSNSRLLAWSQYQPKIAKPEPTATVTRRTLGDAEASAEIKYAPRSQGEVVHRSSLPLCTNYPLTGVGNLTPRNHGNAIPLQPPRSTATDAVLRFPVITNPASLYARSTNYSQVGREIGLAVSTRDSEEPRQSVPSVHSTILPAPPALVSDTTSRVFPLATNLRPNGVQGRARIKAAYYAPGAHPPAPTGSKCFTNVTGGVGNHMANRQPNDTDEVRASTWLDVWHKEGDLAQAQASTGGTPPRKRSAEEKAV